MMRLIAVKEIVSYVDEDLIIRCHSTRMSRVLIQ